MESRTVAATARAALFAALCTLLAVAAHLPMSGQAIPVPAVVFGALAVFAFARIAAALGERGLGSITLLVGGSQVGLHLLFQIVQGPGDQGAAMASMPDMPSMSSMPEMASMPTGSASAGTSGMTAAHALAALAAAWWLRRGEAAVFAVARATWTLIGASWRILARLLSGAQPGASFPAPPTVGAVFRRIAVGRLLRFVVIRRGPPTAVCC